MMMKKKKKRERKTEKGNKEIKWKEIREGDRERERGVSNEQYRFRDFFHGKIPAVTFQSKFAFDNLHHQLPIC